MQEWIRHAFLRKYESDKPIVRKRNANFLYVLFTMIIMSIVLAVLIKAPVLRAALVVLGFVSLALVALIRAGFADTANVIAITFFSLILAAMVFTQPYGGEGNEMFQILGYEELLLIIAGLISPMAYQMMIILAVGAVGLTLDLVLRVIPGGVNLTVNEINYVICLVTLGTSALVGRAIMTRNKYLIGVAEAEAEKNSEQVKRLETVILSSKDALGMGHSVRESSDSTGKLIVELQGTLRGAEGDLSKLLQKSRLISKANDEIMASSKIVQNRICDQTAVVNESSAAIEQMTASVDSIAEITASRRQSVALLRERTAEGSAEMSKASVAVNAVKDSTTSISDVVKVIRKVANQTNLLAMNAAIEAAHAGQAGRGFSVVADEIRALSEETARQVKIIDSSIKGTIASIRTATDITESAQSTFAQLSTETEMVSKAMEEIGDGLKEIASGSSEILQGVSESVNITTSVKDASGTVDDKIAAAAADLEELKSITGDVSAGISAVIVRFDEMLVEAKAMSAAGDASEMGLKQLAETLKGLQEGPSQDGPEGVGHPGKVDG
jgi:methyl-accepting chemotaxis protein